LKGTKLIYKIIDESQYIEDPNNSKFEIIKDWYNKNIDDRIAVI
jgi:hypothetical protein